MPADRDWIPGMTAARAWDRAFRFVGDPSIGYHLGAGGADPWAITPAAAHWKTGIVGLDCSGYVAYAWGMRRKQDESILAAYGGYISCDSIVIDARGPRQIFEPIARPELGALVVYPGVDIDGDGDRDRIGHVAMIGPALPAEWNERAPDFELLQVAHCSGSNWKRWPSGVGSDRRRSPAVAVTTGRLFNQKSVIEWRGKTLRDRRWAAMLVRVKALGRLA
jgi:hypothetical protein